MKTRLAQIRMGNPISMSDFVQKTTATSSSMSVQVLDLSLGIRKTCGPSGTSYHSALTQVARLQKGYMLSGKEVYFVVINTLSYQ
jgi:hypothetical protein